MGRLVPFQTTLKSRPRPPKGQGGDARIIVFTGVRYERREDEPSDHPRDGRKRRKRR